MSESKDVSMGCMISDWKCPMCGWDNGNPRASFCEHVKIQPATDPAEFSIAWVPIKSPIGNSDG